MSHLPNPVNITLHQRSGVLDILFDDGARFELPAEFLRVLSPSAEVKGHGPGQEVLQVGKRGIGIVSLEPVGHYGLKPIFSDGHDSGIYTWAYLYQIGRDQSVLWQQYLDQLAGAGASRDPV